MQDEEFVKSMARELAKERVSLGFTQQEIYDETGIHIGRIESMQRSIGVTTFYRVTTFYHICTYLGVSCSSMMERILTRDHQDFKNSSH